MTKQSPQSRSLETKGSIAIYAGIATMLLTWVFNSLLINVFKSMCIKDSLGSCSFSDSIMIFYLALGISVVWFLFGVFLILYGIYCYRKA